MRTDKGQQEIGEEEGEDKGEGEGGKRIRKTQIMHTLLFHVSLHLLCKLFCFPLNRYFMEMRERDSMGCKSV